MSTGGTTNRNRNLFINKMLRFFVCLFGNILATNLIYFVCWFLEKLQKIPPQNFQIRPHP
jgi:Na+/melibiose symporter-like transporter